MTLTALSDYSVDLFIFIERQGHAKEFVEAFDLSSITGIVLASGDGIVYEVMTTKNCMTIDISLNVGVAY